MSWLDTPGVDPGIANTSAATPQSQQTQAQNIVSTIMTGIVDIFRIRRTTVLPPPTFGSPIGIPTTGVGISAGVLVTGLLLTAGIILVGVLILGRRRG